MQCDFPLYIPNDIYSGDASFSETTWRLGAEWSPSSDILVYTSASTGYKAGGFNLTSNVLPYDAKQLMVYEFGVKSEWLDKRLRINLDSFYYDYEDMQLTTLTTVNNAPGQFTSNAARSTIQGFEIDSRYIVDANWKLFFNYTLTDAEFDELFSTDTRDPAPVFNEQDPAGLGRTDLAGNKIPFVPQSSVQTGIEFGTEVSNGGYITAALNFLWQDDMYLREFNHPEIDKVEAYTRTDATVTYAFPGDALTLTAFVTNIEDDTQKTNVYVSPGFLGFSATSAYSRPRTIGLKLDYQWE